MGHRSSSFARFFASIVGLVAIMATTNRGVAEPTAHEQDREPAVFQWVGTTGHSWGAWVSPGATVEDWVEQARELCVGDEICQVNVFEGPEHATHEIPVPEANRVGLKWVLRYQHHETPRIVIEEVGGAPGQEPRTWTFER